MLSNIHSIDFETTGVDSATATPLEVAIYNHFGSFQSFIRTDVPIPVETSAIHHIIASDIENGCSWNDVVNWIREKNKQFKGELIFVAHNADYEKGILKDVANEVKWICTYKCALRIWPDMPSHKNEVLRYALGLDRLGRGFPQAAHTAGHDAEVTYGILQIMLSLGHSVETLIEWSSLPAKLPKMPMGKHYGQEWNTVPSAYLQWVVKQPDMRPDVKYCSQQELDRRGHATPRPRNSY